MPDHSFSFSPRLHIDGWREPGTTVEVRDPADRRRVVAHAPAATEQEAMEAVDVAVRGGKEWARTSPFARGDVLRRAAEIIAERADELAAAITLEMGKPIVESRIEVGRTVEHTRYFSTVAREPQGYTAQLGELTEYAMTVRAPLGVVAAIGPWNFPSMIPNWKIAPALAYGNSVVFKPAEVSPLSATILVECYLQAGVPAAALSLVLGRGAVVGQALVTAPAVNGVTFTGSTRVGLGIAGTAAGLGKRTQCEMGGKNALVIMDDADLDAAVAAVMIGGYGTSGQRCTSSSRVLAHADVIDEVQARLLAQVDKLVVGPGLQEATTTGPMASETALGDALTGLEKAVADGATLVSGGAQLTEGAFEHGWFMEPALLRGPATGAAFNEELFGPIVSLHEFGSIDEAISLNNSVRYGLSSAIYTSDLHAAHRFVHESDTGMVHVNRPTVGAEPHLPFGGAKESAVGSSELGAAAHFFTKTRAAHFRWSA